MAAFDRVKSGIDQFETREFLQDIVHVYDVSSRDFRIYNDVANEHLLITC